MSIIGTIINVYGEVVNLLFDGICVWAGKEECGDCDTFQEAVEYCTMSWQNDEWNLQLTKEAAQILN